VRRLAAIASALSPPAVQTFLRQSVLLLLVFSLLNASNYAFHVVVSRLLGPSAYGALAALLAVVLILSVPFAVLQTALANKTATLRAQGRGHEIPALAADALKTVIPFAWAAGAVVLVVVAPLLSIFLHVGIVPAVLLAPYVVASVPLSVAYGVLQGELRFKALAALILVGVAMRFALGVTLVGIGLGVSGALLGSVLAVALAVPLGLHLIRVDRVARRGAKRILQSLRADVGSALWGLTSFWVLAEVDIALARHYLSAEDAGYYSSAGLMARAPLFVAAAVGVVAFPRFVAARATDASLRRWLRVSVAATIAIGGLSVIGLVLLREPLISLAFGGSFLPGASLLPVLAAAMACVAVVSVLVYFHIAMASRAYLITVAGVVAEILLVAAFHDSGREIAAVTIGVCFTVALLQYQAASSICRWSPRLQAFAEAAPGRALWTPASLELSVVLPCHNAAPGLQTVLERLLVRLEQVSSYEIIVVSDGSTDETVAVAESLASSGVRVLHYPIREGKGHALQLGLSEARGAYVAFCDADGDIEADAIEPFLALMKLYEPDIVLGSKRHPLSEVHYPRVRRLLSWCYHKLARLLFHVNVRDTQTGFKLIRRDVLAAVLPRMLEKRYAFDLELLVVARSLGFTRVFEAPVRIQYRFTSQVDLRSVLGIGLDTLAIFYRHYVLNTYRCAGEGLPAEVPPAAPFFASPEGAGRTRAWRPSDLARILFVNWRDLENPEAGGAEVFTHEVAKRWIAQGHEVTLLTSRFPGASATTELDGVHVHRLGRLRTGSFHAHVQRELMRLGSFDVVVEGINTIAFLTPLWRHRLPPTIALVHQLAVDVWDEEVPKPLAWAGRRLERGLLRWYRDFPVAAVSNSTRDDLLRLGLTNVTVVPPGRDEPPDVRGLAKEPVPTFLFVGRLAANKRPKHAVEAFQTITRELPSAQLWLVGAGPLEDELARALPPGATLLGRVSRAELYERMARAHCLLVPSTREGWGLVVIEANSVGTPAVGYDVGGIKDSIRDGRTGVLATAGDPESLGGHAVSLVTDEKRYAAMRSAAFEWAEGFSWDTTAERLLELALGTTKAEVRSRERRGHALGAR
jgi:glycosyltransferase involved in cell wall biosynthesis/O-antigen/teichoic acid export membrane protein